MDETRITELLRRFKPVGPPPELRMFALYPVRADRIWPWATAAAALLAAALGLHVAADRTLATIAVPIDPSSVDALAAAMGGDEEAGRVARLMVAEQTFRMWLTGAAGDNRAIEDELNDVR
jgi:hypothetical protein